MENYVTIKDFFIMWKKEVKVTVIDQPSSRIVFIFRRIKNFLEVSHFEKRFSTYK